MLHIYRIIVLLFVCVMLVAPALLQAQPTTSLEYNKIQDTIMKEWIARRDLRSLGDDPDGIASLITIYQKRVQLALTGVPAVSIALIREARDLYANHKSSNAVTLLKYAKLISPDCLPVHVEFLRYHLKGALWKSSGDDMNVWHTLKGIYQLLQQDPRTWIGLLHNLWLYSQHVLILALCCLIGLRLLQTLPLRWHEWQHLLPSFISVDTVIYLIIASYIVVYLMLGTMGLIPWSVLLIWKYLTKTDRFTLLCLALALVAHSEAYKPLSRYFAQASAPAVVLLDLDSNINYKNSVLTYQSLSQQGSSTLLANFNLALIEKRNGYYNLAAQRLQQIIQNSPNFAKAYINLGNIYYLNGNRRGAIEQYQLAISRNSQAFLAHYNLGKVYYLEADLENGKAALKNAKQIDDIRLQRFETENHELSENQFMPTDATLQWHDIRSPSVQQQTTPSVSRDLTINQTLLLIIILICGMWNIFRPTHTHALYCHRCGTICCETCNPVALVAENCQPCHNLYVRKVTIDPEFKSRKERQIRYYQWRQRWLAIIFAFIIPGGGSMLLGRGGVLIMLSSCITLASFIPTSWSPGPFLLPEYWSLAWWGLGFYTLTLYALGIWQTVRS